MPLWLILLHASPPGVYITASLTFNCAFRSGCIHGWIWKEQADETRTESELGKPETVLPLRGGGRSQYYNILFVRVLVWGSQQGEDLCNGMRQPLHQYNLEMRRCFSLQAGYIVAIKTLLFFLDSIRYKFSLLYWSFSVFHTRSTSYCMGKNILNMAAKYIWSI